MSRQRSSWALQTLQTPSSSKDMPGNVSGKTHLEQILGVWLTRIPFIAVVISIPCRYYHAALYPGCQCIEVNVVEITQTEKVVEDRSRLCLQRLDADMVVGIDADARGDAEGFVNDFFRGH